MCAVLLGRNTSAVNRSASDAAMPLPERDQGGWGALGEFLELDVVRLMAPLTECVGNKDAVFALMDAAVGYNDGRHALMMLMAAAEEQAGEDGEENAVAGLVPWMIKCFKRWKGRGKEDAVEACLELMQRCVQSSVANCRVVRVMA